MNAMSRLLRLSASGTLAVLATAGTASAHEGADHGVHHVSILVAILAVGALVAAGVLRARRQEN